MYIVKFANHAKRGFVSVTCRFDTLKSAYQFFSVFQRTVDATKANESYCCFAFLASTVTDRFLLWWDVGDDFTSTKPYMTKKFSECYPEFKKEG